MLIRLLQIIIIIFFTSTISTATTGNISVSAKESEDHIFLIFHHDRNTILNPSFLGKNGRVRSDKPITLKSGYNELVAKICGSIFVSPKDPHLIDLKLNDRYGFLKTIYEEKLVAFKINNPDYQGTKSVDSEGNLTQLEEIKSNEVKIQEVIKTPSKDQNADTLVNISESKGVVQMTFGFKDKNIGAAVFNRGSDLWVVFDSRKDFYIPENNNIRSWTQYTDLHNTILKISLKKNFNTQVSKDGGDWKIKLTSAAIKSQAGLATESKGDTLILVKKVDKVQQIVMVRDQDIGDLLAIVPLKQPNTGLSKDRKMVDYNILPSTQGVAISLISEDVKVGYSPKEQAIEIVSSYKVPEKSHVTPVGIETIKTILPGANWVANGAAYLVQENLLTRTIVSSKDNASKFDSQLNLAQFYFANEMYHESLGMLNLAEKADKSQMSQLLPSLMKAVSMVLTENNVDARTTFADLKNNYKNSVSIHEINIWDKYNEYKAGVRPDSIGIVENGVLLGQYSDRFYWPLMLAELDIASDKKNFKFIDQLLGLARASDDLYINNNLKFYKAQYYYLQDQNNLAEQLLTEIEAKPANGRDFMMADLQLVKILYEQRKLDWISAVQRLHELRFVWRGDNLELKLLMSLALAYKQNGDVINAIRTYKYVLDAFGKQGNNTFFVTSQIVELYNRIFLSDEMQELDDFTVIALFYEFKDFTPIGSDGDRAVLGIARRMLNLDLLDMAIDILQHQVTYRLRGLDRIITANHLALVYLMDKKPKEAVRVMEETDKENMNFAGYKQRNELKAKALIDLGKYQEALDFMKDDPYEDAFALRSEAYFRASRWSDYIALIEPGMKAKISAGDLIKGDQSQDILRLAISYSMLSRISDLDYLSHNIITESKDLKTVVDFLKDTNKPINPHSIDKSLNIDRMKHFVDHQKELLFN